MNNSVNKITDTVSGLANSVNEIVKDRIFSPMYFYFIISWIIVNWKFVYTLLFVDEQIILNKMGVLKVDYLVSLYEWVWFSDFMWSALKLSIIPLVSSFVFVWWITKLSEVFFEKHEEHQSNKRKIKRGVEWREKVGDVRQRREILKEEFDIEKKKDIKYEDNRDFNEWVDGTDEPVIVSGISLYPSEVLYKNDYEAYKEQLNEYNEKAVDAYLENQADIARGK